MKAPYGTDPAYDMMLSRQQLSEQIDRVIKDTGSAATEKVDIQKLIAEVVNQLKSLETSCMEVQSPRAEIENAGKQIQTVRFFELKYLGYVEKVRLLLAQL